MTIDPNREKPPATDPLLEVPLPIPDDPGGAHAKGYSAEAVPSPHLGEGPVPLPPTPQELPPVRVPERDEHVQPTGRREGP
jgi:hypothetical protein